MTLLEDLLPAILHWRLGFFASLALALLIPRSRSWLASVSAQATHVISTAVIETASEIASHLLRPIARWVDKIFNVAHTANDYSLVRYRTWCASNAAAILVIGYLNSNWWTLAASSVLLLIYASLVLGSFLAVEEDYDVWDGLTNRDSAFFANTQFIKSALFVLSTTGFLLASFALFLQHLDGTVFSHRSVLVQLPSPRWFGPFNLFATYLSAAIHALPGGDVALWLMGVQARPKFAETLVGNAAQYIIYGSAFLWAFGVYKSIRMQVRDVKYLVKALDTETDPGTVEFLKRRATRAPSFIKSIIVTQAIHGATDEIKKRYISVVPFAKLYSFPQTALYNFHHQGPAVQHSTIRSINSLLTVMDEGNEQFEEKRALGTLRSLRYQQEHHGPDFDRDVSRNLDQLGLRLTERCLVHAGTNRRALARLRHAYPADRIIPLASAHLTTNKDLLDRARDVIARLDIYPFAIRVLTDFKTGKFDPARAKSDIAFIKTTIDAQQPPMPARKKRKMDILLPQAVAALESQA